MIQSYPRHLQKWLINIYHRLRDRYVGLVPTDIEGTERRTHDILSVSWAFHAQVLSDRFDYILCGTVSEITCELGKISGCYCH